MPQTHVVTWAQNVTPVHPQTWATLQRYCAVNRAELHVIPGRYHNPTSHWSKRAEAADVWAPELVPYIVRKPLRLCRNLVVYGDVSITPTAERPLTGFEAHAGDHSAIFGHPRVQLTTVARPARDPRIFTTTGAVTKPHYIPSKAGKKAERYHSFGATVVEVEDSGAYHIRQLVATKGGVIHDCGLRYAPDGVTVAEAPYLVLGDLHAELHTPQSRAELYQACTDLKPRAIVVHDVLDFPTGSHHNRHRWWETRERVGLLADDLERACDMLNNLAEIAPVVVVPSNHHDHLDRWLQETHPKETPHSAELWIRLWALWYRGDRSSGFERYYRHCFTGGASANVRFLVEGEPLWCAGVFCGYHGHRGQNGARGSIRGFARLGAKVVIGHSHNPGWLDGARQVGVMAPPEAFDYRRGQPDASLRTMCAIWPNGKTQLLHLIGGRYRPALTSGSGSIAVAPGR